MSRSPFGTLTRHFVAMLIAPPLLSDLGVDFLRRTIASLLAVLLVVGIFLTRAMFERYVDLHAAWDELAYRRAVQADSLLMIAIPMLVIGLMAIVMAPLLFPDETDYRVLAPLPVSRFQIFEAKLLAVFIVTGAAIVAINLVMSGWFTAASAPSWSNIGSRWMPHRVPVRVAAHGAAAVTGSVWIFATVMAVQGVCLAFAPDRWRRRTGLAAQGVMFVALLLSIPLIVRIPALDISPDSIRQTPLIWTPVVWFLGVEWWLLDRTAAGYADAARIALIATLIALAVIVASYAWLFRAAETLASDASGRAPIARLPSRWTRVRGLVLSEHQQASLGTLTRVEGPVLSKRQRARWSVLRRVEGRQSFRAVLHFALHGLSRSRLHQIVFLLIAGFGVAFVLGQLPAVFDTEAVPSWRPRARIHAALSAPLLATLSATLALRAVFLLPIDQGASWVFRITESAESRPASLSAVTLAFVVGALLPALVIAGMLHPLILGTAAIASIGLTVASSLILVEVVLRDWCRLPYTCTYLPGKRVLAYTIGVLFTAYAVFVYLNAQLIRWSIQEPWRVSIHAALLLIVLAALRRSRLRSWGTQALEFEDEDPLAIRRLNLAPDERN